MMFNLLHTSGAARLLPIFFLVILCALPAYSGEPPNFLYFYSTTCQFCVEAQPAVKKISDEYQVTGYVFGKKAPGYVNPFPFEVQNGKKKQAQELELGGVPALVMRQGNKPVMIFSGTDDINQASLIAHAYQENGAMTLRQLKTDAGKTIKIVGWFEHVGADSGNASYVISDRRNSIPLRNIPNHIKKEPGKPVLVVGKIGKDKKTPVVFVNQIKVLTK